MSTSGDERPYDVIIVGGGPAGLSAALVLARCRRRVLVLDEGKIRNRHAEAMRGFPTRDGIKPGEFIRILQGELERYEDVTIIPDRATSIARTDGLFIVQSAAAKGSFLGRKLLLAAGVVDRVPEIEGAAELYGRSVFHCPYCDGWEHRDRRLAALGTGPSGARLAFTLLCWSSEVLLVTNGPAELSADDRKNLAAQGIEVIEEPIARLRAGEGALEAVEFVDGRVERCQGLFFSTKRYERLHLAEELGCEFEDDGCLKTYLHNCTSVEGMFAAGDITRDVQFVVVACAQGAQAATGINLALLKEDLAASGSSYPD